MGEVERERDGWRTSSEMKDVQLDKRERRLQEVGQYHNYMVHIPYSGVRRKWPPLIDSDKEASFKCYDDPSNGVKCMHLDVRTLGSLKGVVVQGTRHLGKL